MPNRRPRRSRNVRSFRINAYGHDHFVRHACHELGQSGEFFSIALRDLVPEVGVRRHHLIACPTLGETLNQRKILLVLTADKALPLTSERAKAFMGASIGPERCGHERVPHESQRGRIHSARPSRLSGLTLTAQGTRSARSRPSADGVFSPRSLFPQRAFPLSAVRSAVYDL
jgi:hypothetical protein